MVLPKFDDIKAISNSEISDKIISNIIYAQLKVSPDFKPDVWESIKKSIQTKMYQTEL